MTPLRDGIVSVSLVIAFAVLVTVHVATIFGLARLGAWRLLALTLVVPPAGPVFAYRRGLRVRSALWAVSAIVYGTMLLLSR